MAWNTSLRERPELGSKYRTYSFNKTVFLYCRTNCSSCPAPLNSISWVTFWYHLCFNMAQQLDYLHDSSFSLVLPGVCGLSVFCYHLVCSSSKLVSEHMTTTSTSLTLMYRSCMPWRCLFLQSPCATRTTSGELSSIKATRTTSGDTSIVATRRSSGEPSTMTFRTTSCESSIMYNQNNFRWAAYHVNQENFTWVEYHGNQNDFRWAQYQGNRQNNFK